MSNAYSLGAWKYQEPCVALGGLGLGLGGWSFQVGLGVCLGREEFWLQGETVLLEGCDSCGVCNFGVFLELGSEFSFGVAELGPRCRFDFDGLGR